MFKNLWNDDAGVVTIEYLVLGTFLALALIAGVHNLALGIDAELTELSNAVQGFSQGYSVGGILGCCSEIQGSQAIDTPGTSTLSCTTNASPSVIDVSACQ